MHRLPLLLVCLGASGLPSQAPAPSWPHWRGPHRDGVSRETAWGNQGAEKPLWTAAVGIGHSSVAIADGRLFTLGFDEAKQQDDLRCLDPLTGAERWRQSWPGQIHNRNHDGGTLTTPSIDGDRVFVSNREGECFAFRAADGARLWHHHYAREQKLAPPHFMFAASPLVLHDRILLVLGATVLAVAKADGKVLWRTDGLGFVGYANPVPFALRGRRKVAVFAGVGLAVLDSVTGAEDHRYPWAPTGGGVNVCTPIVTGDRVFISSAYNMGAALLRLGDTATPELLWKSRRMRNKCSGCVLFEDHIYGFDEAVLKCLDLAGNERWRVRGLGFGSAAVAGRRLLILSERGELVIGTADPEGFTERSRRKLFDEGSFWSPPILCAGRIYCRSSLGSLVCLDHTAISGATAPAPAVTTKPQAPTGTPPDPVELFARHAAGIGGPALQKKRSLRMVGTLAMPDRGIAPQPVTIHVTPDSRSLTGPAGIAGIPHRGFDARRAWEAAPLFATRVYPTAWHRALRETLSLHALVGWRPFYARLSAVTGAVFAGQSCWRVRAVRKDGTARFLYFRARDSRLCGSDAPPGPDPDRNGEPGVTFGAWQRFGDVHIPTRITFIDPRTGDEEILSIQSALWDQPPPPSHDAPARVLRLLRTPDEIAAATRAVAERDSAWLGSYQAQVGKVTARLEVAADDGALLLTSGIVPPMWFGPADAGGIRRERDGLPIELRLTRRDGVRAVTLRYRGVDYVFSRQQ